LKVSADEGPRHKIRTKEGRSDCDLLSQPGNEHARAIGIAPETLLRWMKEPEFDVAYREAKRKAFGRSIARLQQSTGAAVTTLLKVMVDPSTPPNAKVRAADSVLNHAAKAIEIEDITSRSERNATAMRSLGSRLCRVDPIPSRKL
jgi:hypothetical protein